MYSCTRGKLFSEVGKVKNRLVPGGSFCPVPKICSTYGSVSGQSFSSLSRSSVMVIAWFSASCPV